MANRLICQNLGDDRPAQFPTISKNHEVTNLKLSSAYILEMAESHLILPRLKNLNEFFKNCGYNIELVSKELNHLATILHVYAENLNFMKKK